MYMLWIDSHYFFMNSLSLRKISNDCSCLPPIVAAKKPLVQITLEMDGLGKNCLGSVRREVIIASGSAWSSDYSLHPLQLLVNSSYKFVRRQFSTESMPSCSKRSLLTVGKVDYLQIDCIFHIFMNETRFSK